jgi:hypothetical protein
MIRHRVPKTTLSGVGARRGQARTGVGTGGRRRAGAVVAGLCVALSGAGLTVRLTMIDYTRDSACVFWRRLSYGVWPSSPPCGRW